MKDENEKTKMKSKLGETTMGDYTDAELTTLKKVLKATLHEIEERVEKEVKKSINMYDKVKCSYRTSLNSVGYDDVVIDVMINVNEDKYISISDSDLKDMELESVMLHSYGGLTLKIRVPLSSDKGDEQ